MNSVIYDSLFGSGDEKELKIKDYSKSMVIDSSFNFICDFVNQKTMIQYLLEKNKIREVNFIVNYLIKNSNEFDKSLEILLIDITQLLYCK